MESARPFAVRYGEGLVLAGGMGVIASWFTETTLQVFMAGCVAAAIGALMLWKAGRHARNGGAG